jgi:aminoglycoside phosphotransferase family enzyme/predicted kinase
MKPLQPRPRDPKPLAIAWIGMDPLIAALLRPEAHRPAPERVELLETHISWILLAGPLAYKIKKPVNLGFVDFSTQERRAWFCTEELRLNRRLCPDLYLEVVPIHGPRESASFEGEGPVIEMALKMRRFPQSALLPAALERGAVPAEAFTALAEGLAAFHARAAVAEAGQPWGEPPAVIEPALANLAVLESCGVDPPVVAALRRWSEAEAQRLLPLFRRRKQQGRVRECHGDLHGGNMALLEGRIEVFDCLEFSPELRWIDVVSDLAFAAMDLQHAGQERAASSLLARWLERSGDYEGLLVWTWYRLYRALVRAKVTALRLQQTRAAAPLEPTAAGQEELASYLAFAQTLIRPRRPVLLITHGISGSGKSHWAAQLAARRGWIALRSDVERKRRFGLWGEPNTAAPPPSAALYDPGVSRWLYEERLCRCAAAALAAGLDVVVDATFLRRQQRQLFAALARRCGARFGLLVCEVDPRRARQRVEDRRRLGGDPSDADAAVIERQLQTLEPITPRERRLAPVWPGSEAGLEQLLGWAEDA